jgi:hypothetical protein
MLPSSRRQGDCSIAGGSLAVYQMGRVSTYGGTPAHDGAILMCDARLENDDTEGALAPVIGALVNRDAASAQRARDNGAHDDADDR